MRKMLRSSVQRCFRKVMEPLFNDNAVFYIALF